ncbi:hypothetical protein AB0758_48150 [Tolypothrix bouteillei VB521301_2]|uniref:hypothetical protein n=1 Tax=Tolypothrix bouteillei TaxID=1246981 RepID=UPI0038B5CBCC
MLADSGAKILLTQNFLRDRFPDTNSEHSCQVICLDSATFDKEFTENPTPRTKPEI